MKKENVLSVLIDESGDFGRLDYNDPYYYVIMVLHEQNNSIADIVDILETKLRNWGYEKHYIHVGPLIRRESPYLEVSREERRSLFNALFSNIEIRKELPTKYRLLQVADLLCTVEMIADKSTLTKSEKDFFYSKKDFKKNILKQIEKKRM